MNQAPAFNGDQLIEAEIKDLVEVFGIKTIIETGTYKADSTLAFEKMVKNVCTIEVNSTYYNDNVARLQASHPNIHFLKGSSPDIIRDLLRMKVEGPILFFLDAHWYNYNPLLDELKVIAEFGLKDSVIAIHDFKVPGKDFGFDCLPDGREYCWELIEKSIRAIFGEDFVFYYNDKAQGACRGIIFIHPK